MGGEWKTEGFHGLGESLWATWLQFLVDVKKCKQHRKLHQHLWRRGLKETEMSELVIAEGEDLK